MNKTFFVKVKIRAGEYEKNSSCLISAPNNSLASDYACYCESHNPTDLEWNQNGVMDLGGEFAYSASVSEIQREDANILKRYHNRFVVNYEDLHKSGNYPESVGIEDYELAVYGLLESNYIIAGNHSLAEQKERIARSFLQRISIFELVNEIASESGLTKKTCGVDIKEVPSVWFCVAKDKFDILKTNYDVFTRNDVSDEIILDCVAFGEDEIVELSQLLNADCSELAGQYAVVHYTQD